MTTIPVEDAQVRLAAIIAALPPGDEVVLTQDNKPVATLKAIPVTRPVPRLGTQRGSVLSMDHFDDPLEEFEEYQ